MSIFAGEAMKLFGVEIVVGKPIKPLVLKNDCAYCSDFRARLLTLAQVQAEKGVTEGDCIRVLGSCICGKEIRIERRAMQ